MKCHGKNNVVFMDIHDYLFPIPRIHVMAEYLAKIGYNMNIVCVRKDKPFFDEFQGIKIWNAAHDLRNWIIQIC
jgi:hypothetical protein